MMYARLLAAFAAMLLSLLCFDSIGTAANAPEYIIAEAEPASVETEAHLEQIPEETLEAVAEAVGSGVMYTPMAGRCLDDMPLSLAVEETAEPTVIAVKDAENGYDTASVPVYACQIDDMAEDLAALEAELAELERLARQEELAAYRRELEARRRAEEERRRIAREKAERARRIAEAQAAREAALRAAKNNAKQITMEDLEESIMKVIAGPEKKTRIITERDKKITAYHEAGHAVVAKMLPTQDRVHQISIIPRGQAAGYTLSLPKDDNTHMSKTEMIEEIITLLGGRVSEQLFLEDICTGASNDIERATAIAKNMVVKYGMSEALGTRSFGSSNNEVFIGRDFGHTQDYSEDVAAKIDAEIKRIIDECYARCSEILSDQADKVKKTAEMLLEKEKVDADEFEALFEEKSADTPDTPEAPVSDEAVSAEVKKSDESEPQDSPETQE